MAKEGLELKTISQIVKPECDWSICIGAGMSFPLFPNWQELALQIARKCSVKIPHGFPANNRASYFTPEVIIQLVYELSGRKENFADTMSEVLYNELFRELSHEELDLVVNCLTTQTPIAKLNWEHYLAIINRKGLSSSYKLAEYIVDSIYGTQYRPPKSILTFNAELLLPSLINAFASTKYKKYSKIINYVVEPTSIQYQGRVPYCFCHGLVPVPNSNKTAQKNFNAKDKLVFSENEYLQLANSAYSWQASSFINTLQNSTVYFVGLSFTDSNLRRWLSWLHRSRFEAIKRISPRTKESTSHYWIELKPKDSIERKWIEASVAHLGIRMIWVDSYADIVSVLKCSIKK